MASATGKSFYKARSGPRYTAEQAARLAMLDSPPSTRSRPSSSPTMTPSGRKRNSAATTPLSSRVSSPSSASKDPVGNSAVLQELKDMRAEYREDRENGKQMKDRVDALHENVMEMRGRLEQLQQQQQQQQQQESFVGRHRPPVDTHLMVSFL